MKDRRQLCVHTNTNATAVCFPNTLESWRVVGYDFVWLWRLSIELLVTLLTCTCVSYLLTLLLLLASTSCISVGIYWLLAMHISMHNNNRAFYFYLLFLFLSSMHRDGRVLNFNLTDYSVTVCWLSVVLDSQTHLIFMLHALMAHWLDSLLNCIFGPETEIQKSHTPT